MISHIVLSRLGFFFFPLSLLGLLTAVEAAAADQERVLTAKEGISWADIGTRATEQSADLAGKMRFSGSRSVVELESPFQKLNACLKADGLWVRDAEAGASGGGEMRVRAVSVGRGDQPERRLAERGEVQLESGLAMWRRAGLREEFSLSVDGLRQDFMVTERPGGSGALVVELAVTGASASPIPGETGSVRLVLGDSGRELSYGRLRVFDAEGQRLAAHMEAVGSDRVRIRVEDTGARYPVRIDPTFSDANWTSLGGIPGANGPIYAAVKDNAGNVYVAGDFSVIGDVVAQGVAKWNGTAWSALAGGIADGSVFALTVDASGHLFAGGSFATVDGQAINYMARWDGAVWSAVGSEFDNTVYALAADSLGNVYAGGDFNQVSSGDTSKVARWNGSTWSAMGDGMDQVVFALAVDAADTVYAGGRFTEADGSPALHVARWVGSTWLPLGSGINGDVFALAVDSQNRVFAGGDFSLAGGSASANVARWDGSVWSSLGAGTNSTVTSLVVDSGDGVFIGGSFTEAGAAPASNVARWSGTAWTPLAAGVNSLVNCLALDGMGRLLVGGAFSAADGLGMSRVALWNGSAWASTAVGISNRVNAVLVSAAGDVYVGGAFTGIGNLRANRVAKWDGSAWSVLGTGLNDEVNALALDSAGNLYAGGAFTEAGGVPANRVARWNGTTWAALGTGTGATVNALVVNSSNHLLVGGNFLTAGGNVVNHVARWNGSVWSDLAGGINQPVLALTLDAAGTLYAGGNFSTAGGNPAASVARWNGTTWSALGSGIIGTVRALASPASGQVYVGGTFTNAGGAPANRVALWNGTTWAALGAGLSDTVQALALDSTGDLTAGGTFLQAGGGSARRIARWDGSQWTAIGSGVIAPVRALAPDATVNLFVGGDFTIAGGKPAGYFAQVLTGLTLGPDLAVEQPLDSGLQSGLGTVSFGAVTVGQSGTALTFTLRNRGTETLTGITVSKTEAGNPGDFVLAAGGVPASLDSEQTATFSVTFSPKAGGARTATLEIASSDPDTNPFIVNLSGAGIVPDEPQFSPPPASQLVFLGQPATFSATVTGLTPLTHQWRRDGVVLAGAASSAYTLPRVKVSDARSYRLRSTNSAGSTESSPVYLGVVTRNPASLAIKSGTTLTLTAQAAAPAGTTLTYHWHRDGVPLSDDARYTGTVRKTLRVSGILGGESGDYHCEITLHTPQGSVVGSSGETVVSVVEPPVLVPPVLEDTFVNEAVALTVTSSNAPVRFTARGLPPGVLLNAATGELSGRPAKAKLARGLPVPYAVTFQAANLAGSSPPVTVNWTILPLPATITGTFNGLLDRNAALNGVGTSVEGLGGTVRVVTTAAGALSGAVKWGKVTVPLKARLDPPTVPGGPFTAIWTLSRKAPLPPLDLDLEIDPVSGALTGTLTDGVAVVGLEAYRATPGAVNVGTFHAGLLLDAALEGDAAYPQGMGIAILKTTVQGGVTWSGQLADGSRITGSTSSGPAGQAALHLPLYAGTGSAQGWVELVADQADGLLSWFKAPQPGSSTTRSYKSGFEVHSLALIGDRYTPPPTGTVVLGLANARIDFTEGGLPLPISQDFTITPGNVASVSGNPNTVSVRLNVKTGTFSAGFVLPTDPARKGMAAGLFVPRLAGGVGFFSLPETSAKTSALLSGRVVLEAD